jgi:hypothetical protein
MRTTLVTAIKYWLVAGLCVTSFLSFTVSAASSPSSVATFLRIHAATETAQNNAACKVIQPFYWEIGNQTEALASGSIGGRTYTANTLMPIASASKWIFGAFVVQAREGQLSPEDIAALNMTSGYTNFGSVSCVEFLPTRRDAQTVHDCFQTQNPKGGNNSDYDENALGKFYYNGGHFQKMAVDFGLDDDNNAALQRDVQMQLGTDFVFTYGSPQLAGGVTTSANNYAIFLRKILSKQLYISDLLGTHAVCTNPATCNRAIYTPMPAHLSWSYSLGHWVESDPVSGDGAYSSAGAFGFYPWVDKNKTFYGIVARHATAGSGFDSAACGGLIRKAWMTGRVQ